MPSPMEESREETGREKVDRAWSREAVSETRGIEAPSEGSVVVEAASARVVGTDIFHGDKAPMRGLKNDGPELHPNHAERRQSRQQPKEEKNAAN